MKTITEPGGTYELREILNVIVTKMSKVKSIGFAKSPYNGQGLSFYISGNNCVTMDKLGNKFGARYCFNGKYYARAAKPSI